MTPSICPYGWLLMVMNGPSGSYICVVCCCPIYFEQSLDLVKEWLLSCVVRCSKLLGTFEHKVLKVVSETCSL